MKKPAAMSDLLKDTAAMRRLAQINGLSEMPPKNELMRAPVRAFTEKDEHTPMPSARQSQTIVRGMTDKELARSLYGNIRIVNNAAYMQGNELILPNEIVSLIDNKAYMNRHKKLARDYGVDWLLKLAELAKTKGKPSNWYARCTSLKQWKQTEQMLIKLFRELDRIRERLQGIGVKESYMAYFLHASRKLSEYHFNRCIENATARGAKDPEKLLAKSIKLSLADMAAA